MTGIRLVAYDPNWTREFDAEAKRIEAVLGKQALRIEHVGSTSIPGMTAKPVIDIQVSVESLVPIDPYDKKLSELGYVFVSLPPPLDPTLEHADKVYPFFQKPSEWPSTHHVHLCVSRSDQERNHIVFRDYLRDHPAKINEYEQLKKELATAHRGLTLESQEQYSLGKTQFVIAVINEALNDEYSEKR